MTFMTSRQNPYVKHLCKLKEDASYRLEQNRLLIEGKTLCEEALKSLDVKNCLVKQGVSFSKAPSIIYINDSVLEKLSTLKNSEGILAEIERPKPSSLKGLQRVLILDGLQNPGNMGALLRSALALGFQGAFITSSSVDPFHPKVIRSSMGASLQLPLRQGTKEELLHYLEEEKLHIFLAEAKGQPISSYTVEEPLALVLGKESSGSSLKNHPKAHLLSIPIEQVDSLNVAIAGSLLMHLIREAL